MILDPATERLIIAPTLTPAPDPAYDPSTTIGDYAIEYAVLDGLNVIDIAVKAGLITSFNSEDPYPGLNDVTPTAGAGQRIRILRVWMRSFADDPPLPALHPSIGVVPISGVGIVSLGRGALRTGEQMVYSDGRWTIYGVDGLPITSRTSSAGSGESADPWTYVRLASAFTTTGTTNEPSNLAFTPAADTMYEVEGRFFLQAAATTTGARIGLRWPTAGVEQNAAVIGSGSSATAMTLRVFGNTTTANAAATGVAVANEGIYGYCEALLRMGATASGSFGVTLASEVSGSEVRLMENSFIRYRIVPVSE